MLDDGFVAFDGRKGVQPAEDIRQMAERALELLIGFVAHLGKRAEGGDIGEEADAVHLADVVVQRLSREDHFGGARRLAHRKAERVCHVVRRAHRDVAELRALLLRQRHQTGDRIGERAVAAETHEPLVVRGVLRDDFRRRPRRRRIIYRRTIPVESKRGDRRAEIEIGHRPPGGGVYQHH